MKSNILYEDQIGEIITRPKSNLVEIRWFDGTSEMQEGDFNNWLNTFASCVESSGLKQCLVDAVQFKMNPEQMNATWRDENIIPRYNSAGVKKFAFIMPTGMPLIGKPPEKEGPAEFPTAYFGNRTHALSWLQSEMD